MNKRYFQLAAAILLPLAFLIAMSANGVDPASMVLDMGTSQIEVLWSAAFLSLLLQQLYLVWDPELPKAEKRVHSIRTLYAGGLVLALVGFRCIEAAFQVEANSLPQDVALAYVSSHLTAAVLAGGTQFIHATIKSLQQIADAIQVKAKAEKQ